MIVIYTNVVVDHAINHAMPMGNGAWGVRCDGTHAHVHVHVYMYRMFDHVVARSSDEVTSHVELTVFHFRFREGLCIKWELLTSSADLGHCNIVAWVTAISAT